MNEGLPQVLSELMRSSHVKNEKYATDEKRMNFGFTVEQCGHVGGPGMPV